MTAPVDPIAVALLVTRTLETLHIPLTFGGSIASSIAGEPRSTIDIDIVVALAEPHIDSRQPTHVAYVSKVEAQKVEASWHPRDFPFRKARSTC